MFTGIIEEVGAMAGLRQAAEAAVISIRASKVLEGTKLGDSIAVNGCCLTVIRLTEDGFDGDVMPETLRRTNLGLLQPNSPVNLERAMAADGRFGGHIVAGHVDGTGVIRELRRENNAVWLTVRAEPALLHYMVNQGSIAIDGTSLTLAQVDKTEFQVSIIPHTGEETTLLRRKAGDVVNLECDVIGKYVEKLLGGAQPQRDGHITAEFLAANGFMT